MSDLVTDGVSLPARITQVRTALAMMSGVDPGAIEQRVAASVAHLGLVARLIAPALVAPLLPLTVDVRLENAWWQAQVGGPYPLSLARSAEPHQQSLLEPVTQLTEAVLQWAEVSAKVLWGNVASAVNSAAVQASAAAPAYTEAAYRSAGNLLCRTPLDAQAPTVGPAFQRQSCCLIYRIAPEQASGRTVCGDCVLRA
jgi:hypothetical protein